MPGTHVRSLGKLDWVERGNEPALTVPGAYWLCHKKNIYKFTFKWHKTLRNAEGFAYPKELTKVIRRILKSRPRQGQQFGTKHLLVTYNHSAWMRQDKMFAMLKFQDRSDATAFPYAFVLTVKTVDHTSAEDLHSAPQDEEPALAVLENAKNARLQDTRKCKNAETSRDDSRDNKSDNRSPGSRSKDPIEIFVTHSEKATAASSFPSPDAENDRKKDPGKKATKRPRSFDKSGPSPLSKKRHQQERSPGNKERLAEIAADSADLPYQYIIEKEIENSKSAPVAKSPGPSNRESYNSIKSLPRSPRIAIADTARSSNITDLVMEGLMFTIRQDQDSVTVVEQKTKLEMDEVLENSEKAETKEGEKCLVNSSLLRLENLITKIEMSEARLKSSEEKPPTLGGNDGNIDKPSPHNSASINSEYSPSGGKFDAKMFNDSPIKYEKPSISSAPELPKFPLVKINLNNARNILSDTLPTDEEVKALNAGNRNEGNQLVEIKEEKGADEVPNEAEEEKGADEVPNEEEEEEDEVGLELKYEDKDDDEIEAEEQNLREDVVPEASQENQTKELSVDNSATEKSPKHDSSSTPIKECIETIKSKTPRVVSNELVTDDQIPPELQRALRFKRSRRLFSSEIDKNVEGDFDKIATEDKAPEIELPALLPVEKEAPEEKPPELATIDLTEEFERVIASGKPRRQPARRKSLRHVEQSSSEANRPAEEPEIHIEMWKFIQDITRGARVVIHRLDLANIPNYIVADSSLQKHNSSRRYATES